MIYWPTGHPRAVQVLLGHTRLESTVRNLRIEVDYAMAIAEQTDIRSERTVTPAAVEPAALDPKWASGG